MLDLILEILKTYWKEIISVVLFIVSFIIACVRKKPVNDILSYIYGWCIAAVRKAETFKVIVAPQGESNLDGKGKREFAIAEVKNNLKEIFPHLDVTKYDVLISAIIEDILDTPQKKVR